jgi:hypothetical protein
MLLLWHGAWFPCYHYFRRRCNPGGPFADGAAFSTTRPPARVVAVVYVRIPEEGEKRSCHDLLVIILSFFRSSVVFSHRGFQIDKKNQYNQVFEWVGNV